MARPGFLLRFFIPALLTSAVAAASIESYLTNLSGYELGTLEKRSFTDAPSQVGDFEKEVLAELVLKSYSRWSVRREDGEGRRTSTELRVFELLDPQGAFGAFTAFRSATDERWEASLADLEVDALSGPGRLVLWKGRFFLDLQGSQADELRRIARSLSQAITERNLYPFTISQLPKKNLISESIRFYLGEFSLATNPVFPREFIPVIGLDKDVEIATAHYEPHGSALFLIGYPTPALAGQYFEKVEQILGEPRRQIGIHAKKTGVMICLFLGPAEEAERLLADVEYSPQVQWLFEKPPSPEEIRQQRREVAGFLGVVMWAILFSLAALAVLFLIGLAFGALRYEALKRFRGVAEKGSMIRLNLDSPGTQERPEPMERNGHADSPGGK